MENKLLKNGARGAMLIAAVSLAACVSKKDHTKSGVGINLKNMDTTVAPGTDFWQYANGGWLKDNPIPGSESIWGSFSELQQHNRDVLKKLLDDAAAKKDAAKGSLEQKVGDFYASGMDSAKLEKDGVAPLKPELERIAAIKDTKNLIEAIAHYHASGFNPGFGFYANQDLKNSTAIVPYVFQGGLGLPDRDYYLKPDQRFKDIREKYLVHIAKMFEMVGDAPEAAKTQAAAVLKIETDFAGVSMSRVELRDPEKSYHKMSVADLAKLTPKIDWTTYFAGIGLPQSAGDIIVGQPDFFKKLDGMFTSVSINDWKTYLRWHLIHNCSDALNNAMVNESFDFYGKTLQGKKELKPRWKRVLESTDAGLGEALGQLYVEKAFSPEAKKRAMEMIDNLGLALKEHINKLDWMSQPTKEKALAKLNGFMKKIGYPDKWKDYSALEVDRSSYLANQLHASEFEFKRNMNKIGKPVDRTEWGMTPPTVNAYYNPSLNEIVFPAGILQPPFFTPDADDAVNYGGMGSVIGHEMTHGFDDEGRQFDAEGNLKNWWTSADSANFMKKAQVLVKQYSQYKVLDSLPVNGQLTLGENIADMGGLTIAYTAYKKSLEGKEAPAKIDGLTGDQRFFLAWAQVWRNNIRPEAAQQRIITDPHSPGHYRTVGIVSNMPAFYEAFNVKPGDAMYRPDSLRAKIW